MKPASVMIVETDADLRNTLRHAFETRGYLTWTCPITEIAESIFAAIQPDVVLLDLDLGGRDLILLIDAWKELAPHTCFIVEGRAADTDRMHEAIDHGARTCFVKADPIDPLIELLEKEHPPRGVPDIPVTQAAA
jgi:DNA-binding NtrC family response regulator